jgi:hypothetical protein
MVNRNELLRREYVSRINRAIDYIDAHLAEHVTLEDLADAACSSTSVSR